MTYKTGYFTDPNVEFVSNGNGGIIGILSGSGIVSTVSLQNTILPGILPLEIGTDFSVSANPTSTTSLMIGKKFNFNYSGGNISGAGHVISTYSGTYLNSPGTTLSLVIGSESVIENSAGTLSLAVAEAATLNKNAAGQTITEWAGVLSQITSNAGIITKASGVSSRVPGNTGTIGEWNGYHIPITPRTGITKARAFKNEDIALTISSAAPICDKSFWLAAPIDGGTTILTSDSTANGVPVSYFLLNPAGTIASHSLTLPLPTGPNGLEDGQTITIVSTQTITSLTWTAQVGIVLYNLPSTISAGGFFKLVYFSSLLGWLRVG